MKIKTKALNKLAIQLMLDKLKTIQILLSTQIRVQGFQGTSRDKVLMYLAFKAALWANLAGTYTNKKLVAKVSSKPVSRCRETAETTWKTREKAPILIWIYSEII